MIDPALEQLSLTVTPLRMLGTAAWQLAPALALVAAGHVTVGGVLSVTVKLVVQEALLPAASVAVTVIVCSEGRTSVSAGGLWLKASALVPLQPPLTVTPPKTLGTAAWQFPSGLAL